MDADESQHKIRLQGIDAPVKGQTFGQKSKESLANMAKVDVDAMAESLARRVPKLADVPSVKREVKA